ncbi:MAG: PilZ domain-containing protein [Treponema sp.]|jgi:hypothetical protein|nr:PilZ domain-containing protein [Treponema sp.]
MDNENNASDSPGKRILFLHPSAVIQNVLAEELVQQEYEVYIVRDHIKLRKILKKYPDSVVFANINDGMPQEEWETWIRAVMTDADLTGRISIGILTANNDEALRRKYTVSIKCQCGFTVLKSDLAGSIKQMCEHLEAIDARGRRKYLRITLGYDSTATVNLPLNGTFINGVIRDISVVGLSCSFDDDPQLSKNRLFQDIQIKLQTQLLKTEGIIFGWRMSEEKKIYVLLFTQRIDPEIRTRIRKYIQHELQIKLDKEME